MSNINQCWQTNRIRGSLFVILLASMPINSNAFGQQFFSSQEKAQAWCDDKNANEPLVSAADGHREKWKPTQVETEQGEKVWSAMRVALGGNSAGVSEIAGVENPAKNRVGNPPCPHCGGRGKVMFSHKVIQGPPGFPPFVSDEDVPWQERPNFSWGVEDCPVCAKKQAGIKAEKKKADEAAKAEKKHDDAVAKAPVIILKDGTRIRALQTIDGGNEITVKDESGKFHSIKKEDIEQTEEKSSGKP